MASSRIFLRQREEAELSERVLLHNEVAAILRAHGNDWMTTRELADAVNARGKFRKRDGSLVAVFQIHGRTKNYSRIFERDNSRVRLREE